MLQDGHDTPRRVRALIAENKQKPGYDKIVDKALIRVPSRAISYCQGDKSRADTHIEQLLHTEYGTKQIHDSDMKNQVAEQTLKHLFEYKEWVDY